ncbi:hypothetical protein P4114_03940 [Pseudomonas aeruginosa]|nr:hypothetical protein [Pseudomonas aeruginosa]
MVRLGDVQHLARLATNNLDSATAGASAIRILVLLGITSFFLLS